MSPSLHDAELEQQPLLNTRGSGHPQSPSRQPAPGLDPRGRSFTVRAVLTGAAIGILINVSNTYYGLQAGSSNQQAILASLLSFISSKLIARYAEEPLSTEENVFLGTVAAATGCMPVTAGLIDVIAGMEHVLGPDDAGPFAFSIGELLAWSVGVASFGLVFASCLRAWLVAREKSLGPLTSAMSHLKDGRRLRKDARGPGTIRDRQSNA